MLINQLKFILFTSSGFIGSIVSLTTALHSSAIVDLTLENIFRAA